MEYTEYKEILDKAVVDYLHNGGSVFYIGNVIKEYVFDCDKEMSKESQNRLEQKAIKAITERKRLPDGIRLKQCIWHGKHECDTE